MNNWQYVSLIPTSPWRSTQSEPRDLSLERIAGKTELIQRPARELNKLHTWPVYKVTNRGVTGTRSLLGAGSRGQALDIRATFDSGNADRFGLKVFVGGGEKTVI